MSGDQLRRLKELEKENERLRRAGSDLTLDKQILKEALDRYFHFYNTKRRHSSLARLTPDAVYFDRAAEKTAA